jgi:uncharacterized repeat protein (TIGR01451 family)
MSFLVRHFRLIFTSAVIFNSLIVPLATAQESIPELTISKTVDQPTPADGEPVLFEVSVTSTGETPAYDVRVKDVLPQGLAIPEGLTIFTDDGFIDAYGTWVIGETEPGEGATMNIPAIVTAVPQPPCIVNTATLVSSVESSFEAPKSASVAIRSAGVERCADLAIKRISMLWGLPCGLPWVLRYTFAIANEGPQEAHDVIFTVAETDFKAPGFELISPGCSGLQCNWDSLPANTTTEIRGETPPFTNSIWLKHEVKAAISTADVDYVEWNNSKSWYENLPPTSECGGLPDYEGELDALGDAAADSATPCFIATAAYGTRFDARIETLRAFRDNTLAHSELGRLFIEQYYRQAPPIAAFIEHRPMMQLMVRVLLVPILAVISYPITSLACLILLLMTAFAWRQQQAE